MLKVVVFDCSSSWAAHDASVLAETLSALRVFVAAFLTCSRANRVAVIGARGAHSQHLLVEPEDAEREEATRVAGKAVEAVQGCLSDVEHLSRFPGMAAAVSMALCFGHAQRKARSQLGCELLVVSRSADEPLLYVGMMNALFAAQRSAVTMDVLAVRSVSSYLNQGAALTHGLYVEAASGFAPLLLGYFLADAAARKSVTLPSQPVVDSRASCFCHGRPCEMGHVCSMCLAIFCSFVPVCSVCSSKLALPSLPSN
jgi:transcription initiation factor TFIIH subunit 3